jgi:uncharacterized protein YkwD
MRRAATLFIISIALGCANDPRVIMDPNDPMDTDPMDPPGPIDPMDPMEPVDPVEPVGCVAPAVSACATETRQGLPFRVSGTVSGASVYGAASCARSGGAGAERVYLWTPPSAGVYEISTVGSSFDTVLSVLGGGCGSAEVACADDIGGGQLQSQLTVTLAECQTIAIVVDAYDPGTTGDFVLSITGRESACDDGADNDGDGATDCEDRDCFSASCSPIDEWPAEWVALEWQMLEEVNRRRAAGATCDTDVFGPAVALEMDSVIRIAARNHSLDMGMQNYFEHDSLDGREFGDRMTEAGFRGEYPWGENIAAGYETAREAVDNLMASPGHCRNIMEPAYRTIGIGFAIVEGSEYTEYWTQDFAASH